jgi:hypothetical protein
MKQRKAFNNMFAVTVSVVLPLILTGCGTSYSVKQPLTAIPLKTSIYVMGQCEIQDNRAGRNICDALQEKVRYGLFKEGLYERNTNEATREVKLTITYFRDIDSPRLVLGVLCGKDGLDVTVEVKDRQNGNIIGRATASNYSANGSKEGLMVDAISEKIIEFLVSGVSK